MATELHPAAQRVVRRVLASGRPFDWVEHFGTVATLDRLAREQDAPPGGELPALLDTPLRVGDVTFRRMSLAAIEWYNQCACAWWADNPALREQALAWCHAVGRNHADLGAGVWTEREARRAVRRWALGLRAPWAAVQAVVQALLPAKRPADSTPESGASATGDTRGMLARLVAGTGLSEEHWLFAVPGEAAIAALRELAATSYEQQATMAALLGVSLREPDTSWAVQSFMRFRAAAKAFLEQFGVEPDGGTPEGAR
jgi:hypothetical protein